MKKYITPSFALEIIAKEDIMNISGEPQIISDVGTVVGFWMGEEQ